MSSSAGMATRGDSGGGESGWAIGESRDPLSEAGGALVPRVLLTGGMAGGDTGGGGERRLLVGVGEEMVAGDMVCMSVKGEMESRSPASRQRAVVLADGAGYWAGWSLRRRRGLPGRRRW